MNSRRKGKKKKRERKDSTESKLRKGVSSNLAEAKKRQGAEGGENCLAKHSA